MNQQPAAPQSSGLDPRLAGLLAYVIPPITGIIFLLVEKTNAVVRWHAAQSTVFGVAWIVLWVVFSIVATILSAVPILGWVAGFLIWVVLALGGFIAWVVCLIKGYSGTMWRMPVLAPYAEKVVGMTEGSSAA